jgi:uncharacterized ferritin-like protein (DUF455 family)
MSIRQPQVKSAAVMETVHLSSVSTALAACDPAAKCGRVAALRVDAAASALASRDAPIAAAPGRPPRPLLVAPREVPNRGLGTLAGRFALAHAVAHIEFNAINLALDACCRFAGMPQAYYADWLRVAQDEARHFDMLRNRLKELGGDYGDLPAHNGLWEAAEKTADDALARMALVPRVLEARGLDVTPGMIRRLREVGDEATAAILTVILDEEVAHVRCGTHWFRHLCAQRGLEPVATFRALLQQRGMQLRAPFNRAARMAAGFVDEELVESQPEPRRKPRSQQRPEYETKAGTDEHADNGAARRWVGPRPPLAPRRACAVTCGRGPEKRCRWPILRRPATRLPRPPLGHSSSAAAAARARAMAARTCSGLVPPQVRRASTEASSEMCRYTSASISGEKRCSSASSSVARSRLTPAA